MVFLRFADDVRLLPVRFFLVVLFLLELRDERLRVDFLRADEEAEIDNEGMNTPSACADAAAVEARICSVVIPIPDRRMAIIMNRMNFLFDSFIEIALKGHGEI